jgi:hypothetical protein
VVHFRPQAEGSWPAERRSGGGNTGTRQREDWREGRRETWREGRREAWREDWREAWREDWREGRREAWREDWREDWGITVIHRFPTG